MPIRPSTITTLGVILKWKDIVCSKCKEAIPLEIGTIVYRSTGCHNPKRYYCSKCYDELYIDLSDDDED